MDAESVGLVRDYVNELLSYVPLFPPLPLYPSAHADGVLRDLFTQIPRERARKVIPHRVSKRESTVPEYLAVVNTSYFPTADNVIIMDVPRMTSRNTLR
jgi:hypothetical protein